MPARARIPLRDFGRSGEKVSALGLGGYHLGDADGYAEAERIVRTAVEAGLTFMDNAWEYHEGTSERWMGKALRGRRDQVFLMTKVCSHGRGKAVALRQLGESLRRLQTDYLDLWQIHEVIHDDDPARHFMTGGAVEALEQAKREGKVRYVGFTGHKDPDMHLKMLSFDFPFDACQLPLNCLDATFRSFESRVLPELVLRGIAPIGMKSFGDGRAVEKRAVRAAEALRYAMSLPVATTVTGMESLALLRKNIALARGFVPMSEAERRALVVRSFEAAKDGRYELYKTSKRHDGPIGREVHGFPSPRELGG